MLSFRKNANIKKTKQLKTTMNVHNFMQNA